MGAIRKAENDDDNTSVTQRNLTLDRPPKLSSSTLDEYGDPVVDLDDRRREIAARKQALAQRRQMMTSARGLDLNEVPPPPPSDDGYEIAKKRQELDETKKNA